MASRKQVEITKENLKVIEEVRNVTKPAASVTSVANWLIELGAPLAKPTKPKEPCQQK